MEKDYNESDKKSLFRTAGSDKNLYDLHTPRGPYVQPRKPRKPNEPGTYKNKLTGEIRNSREFNYGTPDKNWKALPYKWKNASGRTVAFRGIPRTEQFIDQASYNSAVDRFFDALEDYNDQKNGKVWSEYNKKMQLYTERLAKYTERLAARADRRAQQLQHAAEMAAKREKRARRITHKNYSGFCPWNPKYGEFRALTNEQYADIGMDINAVLKPEKTTMTLPDGSRVSVIKSQDGIPLGFGTVYGYGAASATITEDGMTSHEYYKKAFDGSDPQVDKDTWDGDCGHISHLAYSAKAQVLEVTFKNKNETYVYFRVPSTVAGELLTFARGGQIHHYDKDGTPRHLLGVRFWDLIRIRHTHGSRYRYESGIDAMNEYIDEDGERPVDNNMPKWYERSNKELNKEEQLTDEIIKTRPKKIQQIYAALQDYRKKHDGKNPEYRDFLDNIMRPIVGEHEEVLVEKDSKGKEHRYKTGKWLSNNQNQVEKDAIASAKLIEELDAAQYAADDRIDDVYYPPKR